MNKPIILASRSPRRSELLSLCGIDFIVEPSDIEEIMDESLPLDERMQELAYQKALPIAKKHPDDVVVGADTIVYIDELVIGKAHSRQEANDILHRMSGRWHSVKTGVCVLWGSEKYTFTETSLVKFFDLSDYDIEEYLDLDEWQGKAGAYAIQGYAVRFVEKIDGDYSNIVGLPVAKLYRLMKSLKKY